VRGTFRYKSSVIDTSPGPSQIRETKKKEAAFQQYQAEREAARVPIVDDIYRLRSSWSPGAETFDSLVFAAVSQVLLENQVTIQYLSDPYEAMVDDDRITVRMLEGIRRLVRNPSQALLRRGSHS
jgi:hypothetical protein